MNHFVKFPGFTDDKMGKFCWLQSKYVPIEHQPVSLLSYVMYNIEYLCITHFIPSHYFPLLIGYHYVCSTTI